MHADLQEVSTPAHFFRVHLGVNLNFCPSQKFHPGLLVEDLDELVSRCEQFGYEIATGKGFESYRQVYVTDPFGNRLELLELTRG
jgi:catechol 2,3-dioxygenase-like lactoylglutathione lyase family enzyme